MTIETTLEPIPAANAAPAPAPNAAPTAVPADASPATRAEALRGLCGGAVHLPGDPGYDLASMAWNVAVPQRPAAVAVPRDAADVAEVVRACAAAGLRVGPQSTGHNAGPLAARGLDDVVIVRMSGMTGVSIDPVSRTARVVGGTLWQDVVEAAAEHGLAALHGSSPDVAVAGYSLGGGMGWYARALGLATNSLTAVELVTAGGDLVRADAHQHPELFWALRGGGGSFGVVTAMEFRLYEIEDAYAGFLLWDRERADEVVRAWARWSATAPDAVTTSLRVMSFPPMPELPDFLRGRQLVVIDGAVLGNDELAQHLIAPLRALSPEMDTFARVPAASLSRLHMDPEGPTPAVSGHTMLAGLPDEAIDAVLAQVGHGCTTSLLAAEFRQLGGALGRPHPGAGALPQLDGAYAAFFVAIAATPEMGAAGQADAHRLVEALEPWTTGSPVLNFSEEPVDTRRAYAPDTFERLRAIRTVVDPRGLFAANHPVPTDHDLG